ncbi:DUF1294 domain-containing protein [Peribacillus sp. SCS-155]|uniref:DUF1294 domain-containing protein n=1 Tax=Peribacillus sedimenti TaxID=3115297 RepID=UPI003905F96D
MDNFSLLAVYCIVINAAAFIAMGTDKRKAQQGRFRISERTLWLLAIFGGAAGGTAGMKVFRHKTKHLNFKIGLPFLAVCHIILLVYGMIRQQ